MSDNTTILKVITGSRMWGTDTPESDTDYKEIIMAPLHDVLNPFLNHGKGVQKTDDENDIAVYELMHAFRLIEKGNPTMLELLYTPIVEHSTPVGNELRIHRHQWVDSRNTITATLGMTKAQLNRAERYLNQDINDKRIGKLYASTILSLDLSIDVIGSYGKMDDLNPTPHREFMLALKRGDVSCYNDALEIIGEKTTALRGLDRIVHMKANKDFMASFCYYWYRKASGE